MSLWMVIVLLALLKLPIAALMLWIPFRNDQAMNMAAPVDADESGASDDDDGGEQDVPPPAGSPPARAPTAPTSPGTSRIRSRLHLPPAGAHTRCRRHRQGRRDAGADAVVLTCRHGSDRPAARPS